MIGICKRMNERNNSMMDRNKFTIERNKCIIERNNIKGLSITIA